MTFLRCSRVRTAQIWSARPAPTDEVCSAAAWEVSSWSLMRPLNTRKLHLAFVGRDSLYHPMPGRRMVAKAGIAKVTIDALRGWCSRRRSTIQAGVPFLKIAVELKSLLYCLVEDYDRLFSPHEGNVG